MQCLLCWERDKTTVIQSWEKTRHISGVLPNTPLAWSLAREQNSFHWWCTQFLGFFPTETPLSSFATEETKQRLSNLIKRNGQTRTKTNITLCFISSCWVWENHYWNNGHTQSLHSTKHCTRKIPPSQSCMQEQGLQVTCLAMVQVFVTTRECS